MEQDDKKLAIRELVNLLEDEADYATVLAMLDFAKEII